MINLESLSKEELISIIKGYAKTDPERTVAAISEFVINSITPEKLDNLIKLLKQKIC